MIYTRLLAAAALMAGVGCAADTATEPVATGDDALINGALAKGKFPATFFVLNGCTATRIAPRRFVTAAHCIEGNPSMMSVGTGLWMNGEAVVNRRLTLLEFGGEIVNIAIDRSRIEACANGECLDSAAAEGRDTYDVAVVTLDRDIDSRVATADVDLLPVDAGTGVSAVGAGCENGVARADLYDYSRRKLKYGQTSTVPTQSAFHRGSFMLETWPEGAAAAEPFLLFTLGPSLRNRAFGLCPGDSGGPLYRGQTNRVVGINATYTFTDGGNMPATNGFTRLGAPALRPFWSQFSDVRFVR